MTERDLFLAVLEIDDPAERAAYLDRACASQPDLRAQVEQLLTAHRKSGVFMDRPAAAVIATADEPIRERPGTVIDPYKLLEQIGEGGFGVVFMAEQTQPMRRRVALKVIKPGMDTRQVIARFEAERQALAVLDHPNIAKVFDAGETASGLPYFVMELVKGVPITRYSDENHLTPRERLGLFVSVCQAVQHAHQKGIIHRDLKPSNILVTVPDGQPSVKIIDFGIAKATGGQLTDKTLFTGFAQMIGTPPYMSPEQAGQSLDIDTRSDIYSLGVLLYELLTGTTPFHKERFKTAAYDEIRRIIREEEPPKPSTRLSESKNTLASISAQRQTEPAKMAKLVRGELDWIVMKALDKDRNRRYETVNGFAMDLQRYLDDEPVQACPPSAAYRFRKFVRRNKAALTTFVLIAVALIGGALVSSWQAVRATNAERLAQARLEETDIARKEAIANFQKAREAVDQMLTRVADDKLSDVPQMELIRKALLEDALKFYREFLNQKGSDPELRVETGRAWLRVGRIYSDQDQNVDAEKAMEQSIAVLEQLVADVPSVSEYRALLADACLHRGNMLVWSSQNVDEGAIRIRRALVLQEKLVAEHLDVEPYRSSLANTQHGLAEALMRLGKLQEAEDLNRHALAVAEKLIDEFPTILSYHSLRASSLHQLTRVLILTDRKVEAEKTLRQSLLMREKLLAEAPASQWQRHTYAWTLGDLAKLLWDTGRSQEAEQIYRRAIPVDQQLVADFPNVLNWRSALAGHCIDLGQLLEASKKKLDVETFYRQAWATLTEKVGAGTQPSRHWFSQVARAETALVGLLTAAGRTPEVEAHYRQAVLLWEKLATQSPAVLDYRWELARTYGQLGSFLAANKRPEEAEKSYRQALTLGEKALKLQKSKMASDHADTITGMRKLAALYTEVKEFPRAEALFRDILASRRKKLDPEHPDVAYSLALLGHNLLKQKKCTEAEPLLRECLAIREKKLPEDWLRFNALSLLGDSLLGQKKYAEAEPPLLQGYEGLKERKAKIAEPWRSIRLAEALERLVQLCDVTGKKDEAAKWRKELEAYRVADDKTQKPKQS